MSFVVFLRVSCFDSDVFSQALLNKNAKVYLAARSKSKADAAIEWLKQETGGKAPIFLELDLASLKSVKKAAEEYMRCVYLFF